MIKTISTIKPQIMGVINLTPDSYFPDSRIQSIQEFINRIDQMIKEGADIIDLGAMSTRPGAKIVSPDDELERLKEYFLLLRKSYPKLFISIDTVHSKVAEFCLDNGADMINDISAGAIDEKLHSIVAKYNTYYCLMHMQNTPETMQLSPEYQETSLDVLTYLKTKTFALRNLGIHNILIDPGFGFGKSIEDNYRLLNDLSVFQILDCPILVGLSRKSMIYKPLNISPSESLAASSALHLQALQNGAKIIRVHDVKEAKQVVSLFKLLNN